MNKKDIESKKDLGQKIEHPGANDLEAALRDVFFQANINSVLIERLISDIKRFNESKPYSTTILSGEDIILLGAGFYDKIKDLIQNIDILDSVLQEYLLYINNKIDIVTNYQKGRDWEKVLRDSVYFDENNSVEGFIDFIEEVYKIKVKDHKHLQELTGITHYDTGKDIIKLLEETIIKARYSKYFRSLEKALQNGAKYKDLLKIKPQSFGLDKTWSGCLASDQYSSILWTIALYFNLDEVLYFMAYPNLRSIAQEIEAPYSVIMDSYKTINR